MKKIFRSFAYFLAFLLLLTGCKTVEEKQVLSAPTRNCPIQADWKGIIPGQSTQKDVTDRLGQPLKIGIEKFDKEEVKYFSYPIENGLAKDLIKVDRIFFTSDGVVSWIELGVVDRDGKMHTVKEIADPLGYQLDSIFMNADYKPNRKTTPTLIVDVHRGPDYVYVWSHCGVAVIGLPGCGLDSSNQVTCTIEMSLPNDNPQALLALDKGLYYNSEDEIANNSNAIVLLQYFFPPTSYADFNEFFLNKTAYYGWRFWDGSFDKYRAPSQ